MVDPLRDLLAEELARENRIIRAEYTKDIRRRLAETEDPRERERLLLWLIDIEKQFRRDGY